MDEVANLTHANDWYKINMMIFQLQSKNGTVHIPCNYRRELNKKLLDLSDELVEEAEYQKGIINDVDTVERNFKKTHIYKAYELQ